MANNIINGANGSLSYSYTMNNSGQISIGIIGLGGGLGQTSLTTATITHFDPSVGRVVQDRVIIGGSGTTNTTVRIGSEDGKLAIGQVRVDVAPLDNLDRTISENPIVEKMEEIAQNRAFENGVTNSAGKALALIAGRVLGLFGNTSSLRENSGFKIVFGPFQADYPSGSMPVDPNYKGGLPDLLGWGAGVTSRDHADNPYGPNALQIGGIDPAQLAVAVLKSIINHPGTNPSLGPDPFNSPNPADRQGPNGGSPFSYGPQPYNPLNNDERHHGGGDSNADSGGTYTPSNGVTGEGRGGGPVSGPDRALGGPKSDSGGDGGDSFADHDRSPSPSGGSPGPTGGQGSNYSPSSGHSTPSSPNKPSGGTPSPRSSGATGSVHDPKHTNGTNFGGPRPIVLDIAGTGIAINELTNSNKFFDAEGTGLLHRTAWAGVGSGVLFYDAGNDGVITEKREYVFTEWDPTARGDLEAIRSVFDTNGDGVLNASDAEFSKFKVEVTLANGTTEVKTLTELGITSINLKADLTNIQYADGSAITGQTTFTRSNGTTGTVANAVLAAEATGYAVTNTSTVDAAGTRTTINVALASDGSVASSTKTVTTATGGSVTSFDNNGDGVYDRVQTKTVSSASGVKTEVITNRDGGNVLIDSTNTVTQTSAGVKTVTISRDESGGNYITQREVQTTAVDGSRTIAISDLNADGSVIRSETTGLNVTGLTRTVSTNMDNDAFNDRITTHTLTHVANVSSKETTIVMANNETVLGKAFDMMVINHFSTSSQANDNQFPALQRVA